MKYKFLFVTCVNDEEVYERCVKHIGRLYIPLNSEIELMPIRDAKSMAEGYNRVLKHPAKYKIYLHQDTFILNREFLREILQLFLDNPKLGMLGVTGTTKIDRSGKWWVSTDDLVGKLIKPFRNIFLLDKFPTFDEPFKEVEAIDGLLMATQYDISWREDLFKGFHFYDTSQSLEFIKAGYSVAIPKQIEPWCIHYDVHHYEEKEYDYHRKIFLKNYKNHMKVFKI